MSDISIVFLLEGDLQSPSDGITREGAVLTGNGARPQRKAVAQGLHLPQAGLVWKASLTVPENSPVWRATAEAQSSNCLEGKGAGRVADWMVLGSSELRTVNGTVCPVRSGALCSRAQPLSRPALPTDP